MKRRSRRDAELIHAGEEVLFLKQSTTVCGSHIKINERYTAKHNQSLSLSNSFS